jgi:hypothetical protein
MKKLIEDYKRRLKTINEMLIDFKSDNTTSVSDIRKLERLITKASEYRTFIIELERALSEKDNVQVVTIQPDQTPKLVSLIDFSLLRTQKKTLIEIIDDMEKKNAEYYKNDLSDLNGILNLIDCIQDFAVDVMEMNPINVFDFEVEENREDVVKSKIPEEEFARVNAGIIYQMHVEGTVLFDEESSGMPKAFVKSIVDDKKHSTIIKDMIRRDILNDVFLNPDNFEKDPDGNLTYDSSMYDYGFAIEEYCTKIFKKENK